MSATVFISYASEDHAVARTICDALENRGFACWIASRDIQPGENFQVAVVRAIRSVKAMIMVFSAHASNSEEIKKELVLAGQSRLVVIPVRVEDVTPDEAFAYEFATRQWIDAFDDWEESMQRLVRQLSLVAGVSLSPQTTAGDASTTPAAAEPSGQRTSSGIAGDAVMAAAADPAGSTRAGRSSLDWRLVALPGAAVVILAAGIWLWDGGPATPPAPSPPRTAAAPAPAAAPARPSASAAAVPAPATTPAPQIADIAAPDAPDAAAPEKASHAATPVAVSSLGQAREAYARKDYAEAMRLARQAAGRGDPAAQRLIGYLYLSGLGVAKDYAEALHWYGMAAEQGDAIAENGLGLMHQNGWGVTQDYGEAKRWFQKAADKGNMFGEANLGRLYHNGWGVPRDYAEAMRWFQKAADRGNPNAEYWIGMLYAAGQGVPRDLDQARDRMQKAALGGNENARKWLSQH